jgi:anti-sigma factor RsiW
MTHCPPDGDLRAFLDGDLPADAQAALERHLASCPACAARRDALHAAAGFVGDRLAALGAPPDALATSVAWQRLQAHLDTQPARLSLRQRLSTLLAWPGARSLRLGLSTALASLVVIAVLAVTPMGSAAVQALSVFRVTTFKALTIEVDPTTHPKPTEAQRQEAERRRQAADPARVRQEIERELAAAGITVKTTIGDQTARQVADLAAARAAAGGAPVRTLTVLPPALAKGAPNVSVADATRSTLTVDLAKFRQALRDRPGDTPGGATPVDPNNLPGINPNVSRISATVDTSFSVVQQWGEGEQALVFAYGPSPVLTLSEGIDVQELCLALKASPVLSKTNRAQLDTICADPASLATTLLIPVPAGAIVKDVRVGGFLGVGGDPALLVLDPNGKGGAVFAQRNGILYVVAGGYGEQALLQAINSIR